MAISIVSYFASYLQMSNWLTMEIVSLENIEERGALYARLVDVMSVSTCTHVRWWVML